MAFIKHFVEIFLLLIILGGPLPLCLSICLDQSRIRKQHSIAYFLLLLFTIWSITEVSIGLFLGLLKQFNLQTAIALNLTIFLIGLLILSKGYSYRPSTISFKVNSALNKAELTILSSIVFVGFALVKTLATEPITDFDSLWFHLPAIARWYQTASLTLLDATGNWIFAHPDATRYPYNWHILSALFVLPFQEDFLAAFPMFLAWILLGLSVYLLSIEFGATRFYSMAGAALVLTMPMLLNHVNTIHIDLPLASFFIVSLYLAISYHRTRSSIELALFLACLGMVAGIKTPGIIYSLFLATVLSLLKVRRYFRRRTPSGETQSKQKFSVVAVGVFACSLLGSFWYIHNSNELHHQISSILAVKVASTGSYALPNQPGLNDLGTKIYDLQRSTLTNQFSPVNLFHWKLIGIQSVARLQLPFVSIFLQVMLLPIALINGQNKIKKTTLVYLSALLFFTGFLYWNTPYSSGTDGYELGELSPLLGNNMRYGFPFLGMLGVVAAVSATAFNTSIQWVAGIVCLSSLLGLISNHIFDSIRNQNFVGENMVWASAILTDLIKSSNGRINSLVADNLLSNFIYLLILFLVFVGLIILGLNTSVNAVLYRKWQTLRSKVFNNTTKLVVAMICIGLVITTTWVAREERDGQRAKLYRGIYEYLDQNISNNEKIAYFSSSRNYLFYGKKLDKQVLHTPFQAEQAAQWFEKLRRADVSLIAVGPAALSPEEEKEISVLVDQGALKLAFGHDVRKEPVLYWLSKKSPARSKFN